REQIGCRAQTPSLRPSRGFRGHKRAACGPVSAGLTSEPLVATEIQHPQQRVGMNRVESAGVFRRPLRQWGTSPQLPEHSRGPDLAVIPIPEAPMSRPAAALVLVLLGPAVAAAQEKAPLAWKWHKGEEFTLSVTTAYEDQTTVAGKQRRLK